MLCRDRLFSPSMAGRVGALAVGASSGNVLLGQQYELMPFDGTVEFLAFGSGNLVTCSIFSGPDILTQPGATIPFGGAEASPNYPDHVIAEDEASEGDRLSFVFVNGGAAARDINWRVMLSPGS